MNVSEKIIVSIKNLPESKQIEVLDFVEYLEQKTEKEVDKAWSDLSISSAMKGMEAEESPYSQADFKETFS